MMNGYIHSYESMAAVDGEGLRYAVFLYGCPLRCAYCHNPDTWYKAGKEITAAELVRKMSRYKPYFRNDGGITFSGGEPLLQAEFIQETIPLLKKENINYIIDTSGAVKLNDTVKYVLSHAQSVLLDLKFWDNESYIKYTGKDMTATLNMLDYLDSIGKKTTIRTVVVPGVNDNEEILSKYLKHVKDKKCVAKYELLAFHTMGFFKYENLGIENRFADKPALDKEVKEKLQNYINISLNQ